MTFRLAGQRGHGQKSGGFCDKVSYRILRHTQAQLTCGYVRVLPPASWIPGQMPISTTSRTSRQQQYYESHLGDSRDDVSPTPDSTVSLARPLSCLGTILEFCGFCLHSRLHKRLYSLLSLAVARSRSIAFLIPLIVW